MERKIRAAFVLLSGRYERESFLKNIYQTFTPISMFNSYLENILHQELYVCERAHGEFIIWTWAFYIVQSLLSRRGPLTLTAPPFINISLFTKTALLSGSLVKHWTLKQLSMTKTWQEAEAWRILGMSDCHFVTPQSLLLDRLATTWEMLRPFLAEEWQKISLSIGFNFNRSAEQIIWFFFFFSFNLSFLQAFQLERIVGYATGKRGAWQSWVSLTLSFRWWSLMGLKLLQSKPLVMFPNFTYLWITGVVFCVADF